MLVMSNWQKMTSTCEQAAGLFPNSLYCGVDLMILPDWQQHAVLEINAFGDLLPGILWNGMDTYTSEVKAILRREGEEGVEGGEGVENESS